MTKRENILTIYGLLQKNSGTFYHRIKLPLENLHGKNIEIEGKQLTIDVKFIEFETGKITLTKEMLEGADLIYTTWVVNNNTPEMSFWKQELQFKYIIDIDDWPFDDNELQHVYYNETWKPAVLQQCVFADFITTTNNRLASKLYSFNDKIAIIPNILPINEGQFVSKPDNKKYDKSKSLRVGILGSDSHYFDFMSLKGAISRFAKNKNIADNCEFIIAGYASAPNWERIVNLFKVKKNLKVRVLESKPVESYMELYNELDVVLAPLLPTVFNQCKSALKIIESSIKDCIVIGSPLYAEKEFSALCIAEKPIEYEQFLTHLLEDDSYIKLRDELCALNLKTNDFSKRVDFTKNIFSLTMSNKIDTMPIDLEIYGIVYDENQATEFIRYDNSGIKTVEQKSYLFEYNVMRNIIEKAEDDKYYGLFSWKFPIKTGVTKKLLLKLLDEIEFRKYDVINLSPNIFGGNYLRFSYEQHPGLKELLNLVCNDLGLKVREPENVVFSNFFIAKGNTYKKFLNDVINPAINLMETKYFGLAMKDANYKSGLSPEELKDKTGMTYYTFQTFVCERLLSIWLENNKNIKIKNIL